jgi:hypothetical protein
MSGTHATYYSPKLKGRQIFCKVSLISGTFGTVFDQIVLMKKAYLIPVIAVITFAIGTVCMMLPFLPFGWALYALTTLILMPYFKPLSKVFMWVANKDKTNTVVKIGHKIAALYRWTHQYKIAREVDETVKEAEENNAAANDGSEIKLNKKPAARLTAGKV